MPVEAISQPLEECPGATTELRHGASVGPPKRTTHNVQGLPSRGAVFSHRNTVGNLHWSLRDRVLGTTVDGAWAPTLKPDVRFATPGMLRWRDRVLRKLVAHIRPISHSEFCGKLSGAKKQRYLRAKANIEQKGNACVDGRVRGFLKPEKWILRRAPRVISPRSPEYLLSVGVYTEPLEKMLYRAVAAEVGSDCIMKGYNLIARAKVMRGHWDHFEKPVAVGLDASKFDQHVSREALQYEHGFYLRAHNNDATLRRLLKMQLRNKVSVMCEDGRVKWVSDGGRMSGDMNTALGNCLLSASLLSEWARERGVRIRMVVDGDDCVAFMNEGDLARFLEGLQAWYRHRGFIMKVEEPVRQFEKVEFCQCLPVLVGGTWRLVRNFRKAVTQDHVWIERGGITHLEVCEATGEGGMALYGDCPVLGAYYKMLRGSRKLSRRAKAELVDNHSWLRHLTSDKVVAKEPDVDTRVSFAWAFDILPSEQKLMERQFAEFDLAEALGHKINTKSQSIEDIGLRLESLSIRLL